MASSNGFPKFTSKAWRTLRSRAAAAPTTKFTPATVAALMGMSSPKSAADNTVYPMRRIGLIDEEGSLTARGNKWRVDGTFGDACDEILADVYPDELSALTDASGKPDPQKVRTWFDHKGYGDSNARQMAATYVMIASKEIPDSAAAEPKAAVPKKSAAKKLAAAKKDGGSQPTETPAANFDSQHQVAPDSAIGPSVHLDIQIHVPADATPEQIDQIFASMAKHLYQR